MPYYCTVPRCTSMAGKAKNVSFHQFPRDEELARLWNDILKRGKPYTKYSKVCSLHFKPEDYTITSVGKNKGQWRTLRKDAVPSQNLPSETPAPYSRKQWESWSQGSSTPVMDPTIHQQMAQAIYMQTMLAMQAAGTTEAPPLPNEPSIAPELPLPHTSNEDILKGKEATDGAAYKCTECTKCFKDPDVFILHKRCHTKDIKTNGVEKENFNMNLTLRSNPILANLLKTNNEVNFDPNIVTMENLLMTALAANIDYLRNFSMVKEERDDENHDRGDINHDSGDINHDRGVLNRDSGDINPDSADKNRDSGDINRDNSDNRDRGDINRLHDDSNHSSRNEHSRNDLDLVTGEIDSPNVKSFSDDRAKVSYAHGLNLFSGDINASRGDINLAKGDINISKSDINISRGDLSHQKGDVNMKINQNQHGLSYAMNFSTKLDRSEKNKCNRFYKEKYFNSEYERHPDAKVKSYDECDNDLNESLDSNSLVIDETV